MVFYFTATGNSLYVARSLSPRPISIAQAIHDAQKVYQDEQIGIVCPVFGHEMPPLVKDFLQQARFETDYLYLILTYGNRHGGAAELARDYAQSIGLHPAYVNVVLMVDNFLPAFDMDEQRQLDKQEDAQIERIRADLAQRKRWIAPVTDQDRAAHQSFLSRAASHPGGIFRDLYRITDACVGCGICTRVCPRGCFRLAGQRSVWDGAACMACMACIHACPTLAIQLKGPEKNPRARYRHGQVSLNDLVAANQQNTSPQEE